MNKENVLYLEIKNGEILKCDTCKQVIDTFAYLYIDESSKLISKLRCKECYNQKEGK